MRSKMRCLLLDIETSILLAYVFGTGKQVIRSDQIAEDWRILCYTAKWLDKKKVIYEEARTAKEEPGLLRKLWKLLDEADIVITQNGTIFDAKRINARFIQYGFMPPSPYKHYDLYRLVKAVADFTSKSLAYLTFNLCKRHKKLLHKKFAGRELWIECRKGNPKAWKEMKHYNIEDVLSMEELYYVLRAWAPDSFPKVFNLTNSEKECATCGHKGQLKKGTERKAKKHWYRQDVCTKCGAFQPKVIVRRIKI